MILYNYDIYNYDILLFEQKENAHSANKSDDEIKNKTWNID